MSIHIIACGVFRDALRQIELQHFHQNVTVTYIDPYLHNYPQKLKEEIRRQIDLAQKAGDQILCLYGRCYPDLDDHLNKMGIPRVPGEHCYEILLGSKRFHAIVHEEAGTYFLEKNLVLNFPEYCMQPLELDDPLMRKSFFQFYKRLAYIRQPLDPDTVMQGMLDISKFLKLKPMMIDADYSELKTNLLKYLIGATFMKKLAKMKILVVDDDPVVQELLETILTKNGYKNIQIAGSGEEALEMIMKNYPDLVVLDIQLPGIKGYEVSRKLRTNKNTAHIPILMMTGGVIDIDQALEKSFRSGVTDFITKPIKPVEFTARVKSALTIKKHYNLMRNKLNKQKRPKTKKKPEKARNKKVWLNILPDDAWIKVRRGTTVWHALQNTEIELEGDCGGLGKCGKCKIRVITPIGAPSAETSELLEPEELDQGVRLACQTKILRNLAVYTEDPGDETEFFQILKHGHMPSVERNPLIERCLVTVPPPSIENPLSDVQRIREVLSDEYQDLKTTYRCLFSLYKNLRATNFDGAAVIHNNCLLEWQPRESIGGVFGLIFDLGTSTLVGKLVNLLEGQEVAVISRLNSQRKYGADVISRIQYIKGHPKRLLHLQKMLIRDLNIITRRLLESFRLKSNDILVAVAAGNTTMQHFMLSLDPSGIAEAPFTPLITEGMTFRAQNVGLTLHPDAMLYVMPAKSGYIGGDLIGFILSSKAAEQDDKLVLGLDLGTNSEIFLGNKSRMLTCSAAAGPALEGAKISHGMIAKAGAIESLRFEENDLFYNVIGNIKPKGICGSGLVDLAALLLHHRIVSSEGLIYPPEQHPKINPLSARVIQARNNEVYNFIVATAQESLNDRPVILTQQDIRELQLAKAAIAAGIKILLKTIGAGIEDIDAVYLAGALGNYVHPLSAMRIGLLPRVDSEKIISLANAASTGANMVLLSKHYWKKSAEIATFLEHLELSGHTDFFDSFVEEMNFPTENLW